MSDSITVKSKIASLPHDKQLVLKRIWAHLYNLWNIPITESIQYLYDEPTNNETKDQMGEKLINGTNHSQFNSLNIDSNDLYMEFWDMLRVESPDCHILRFTKARTFHVDKTIHMLSKDFKFRHTHQLNQLLNEGEYNLVSQQDETSQNKDNVGISVCLKKQKAVIMGHDKHNRPIILVRPKFHYSSDQTESALEKYALLIIETSRLFMKEGEITILFDLTDFSLSNMDYAPVKFIITCFEAHFPESLGSLLIHKAPWLFTPIWAIVKKWLDPVVASKIVFTNKTSDLNKYIDSTQLPTYLKGTNDSINLDQYSPPDGSHDTLLHLKEDDVEFKKKQSILDKREQLIKKFQDINLQWIQTKDELKSQNLWKIKCEIGEELCQNYVELDPYIRSRSSYDINRTLKL